MINMKRSLLVLLLLGMTLPVSAVTFANQVTITMIAESRTTHFEWQQEMVEAFEAAHPNIRIELVSIAGSGNVLSKMQSMLVGGVAPDIGYMDPWLVVQWGKAGILEDLSPYLMKHAAHFADWNPTVFDFYRVQDGMFAIPQDLQIGAIFYNVDHYESIGLAPPTTSWTYDDLRENARRLTVRDAEREIIRHGFRLPGSRNWVPVVWAFGGDLVDDWAEPSRFTGNTPETASALRYLNELVQIGAMQDAAANSNISFGNALPGQHVSMVQTNTIAMANFHPIDHFEWDAIGMPHGPAGKTAFINAIGWFMFSSSPYKEEAWQVLQFFTTPEAQRRRVEITGNTPVSLQVIRDTWLPRLTRPASRELLLEEIAAARSPWPLHGDLWNPINQEALAAIWGEQPVEGALSTMENIVNAVLRDDAL